MTIETEMLKPIKEPNFDKLEELISEYREIKNVVRCGVPRFEVDGYVASDWMNKKFAELLVERLEILESELNLLGYTFEDEPKEWQYHVNFLKGEDDE